MQQQDNSTSGPIARLFARPMRRLRELLSSGDAPMEYAVLGIVSGLITGLVIVAFRLLIELPLEYWLPNGHAEAFESLPGWAHFLLPFAGASLIGLALWRFARNHSQAGLPHVVFHVHNHDSKLPWQNACVQFFAGIACLWSGQSVGREGPAIHLGAATNSLLGQTLGLPNNCLRVLAGCGTAAAIAASFNTPIAGVIFAMEVVLVEYTIAGFIPIILAAVSGTVIARLAFGNEPFLALGRDLSLNLGELLLVVALAFLVALASSAFVVIQKFCLRFSDKPIYLRLGVAGFATGCLALLAPQILGTGADTMGNLIQLHMAPMLLITIIAAKLLASSLSIGLGMPGGLISPNLFIGACIGALVGQGIAHYAPELADSTTIYPMLGMAAMMSAVLNAPLAGLMALVELTYSPDVIFPGLLVITVANIVHRELFRQPSAVQAVMDQQGVDLHQDPVSMALQKRGVTSIMNGRLVLTERFINAEQLTTLAADKADWLVFTDDGQHYALLRARLPAIVQETPQDLTNLNDTFAIGTVDSRANLKEAWQLMLISGKAAVLVKSSRSAAATAESGIITREALENLVFRKYGANL